MMNMHPKGPNYHLESTCCPSTPKKTISSVFLILNKILHLLRFIIISLAIKIRESRENLAILSLFHKIYPIRDKSIICDFEFDSDTCALWFKHEDFGRRKRYVNVPFFSLFWWFHVVIIKNKMHWELINSILVTYWAEFKSYTTTTSRSLFIV